MNRWLLAGTVVVATAAALLLWQLGRGPDAGTGADGGGSRPAAARDAGAAGGRSTRPGERPTAPAAAGSDAGGGAPDVDLRDWPPGGSSNPREGRSPHDDL